MIEPIIDVSKWQREINASKMLGAGTLGMYIKAGGTDKYNGASYTDRRFRENAGKFSSRVPVDITISSIPTSTESNRPSISVTY